MTSEDVYDCVRRYIVSWKDGHWDDLRALLAPEVRLEGPTIGTVEGIDAHVALYREHRRFPKLDELVLLGLYADAEGAIASYDVYLSGKRNTVFDQFRVSEGKITRILSVQGEWHLD
jgi:hypothetical protein